MFRIAILKFLFLKNTEKAKEDIKLALGVLNQHLATRTFLVGERITLADICVATTLLALYEKVIFKSFDILLQRLSCSVSDN